MDEEKKEFLNNEILSSSIFAGLTRNRIYKQKIDENDRIKFKNNLKHKLKEYGRGYKTKISDTEHIENIKRFSDGISAEFGKILNGNRFRIGTSQKLLNLYLKYLWILGWISEPPHCPFDSIIIAELGLGAEIKFTKFDSEEDYNSLVTAAAKKAKDAKLSIAQWELKVFNRRFLKQNKLTP